MQYSFSDLPTVPASVYSSPLPSLYKVSSGDDLTNIVCETQLSVHATQCNISYGFLDGNLQTMKGNICHDDSAYNYKSVYNVQ